MYDLDTILSRFIFIRELSHPQLEELHDKQRKIDRHIAGFEIGRIFKLKIPRYIFDDEQRERLRNKLIEFIPHFENLPEPRTYRESALDYLDSWDWGIWNNQEIIEVPTGRGRKKVGEFEKEF